MRNLFGRSQMDEREVQILQGIWSQMDRYLRIGKKAQTRGISRRKRAKK